jgi:hypothetical protein
VALLLATLTSIFLRAQVRDTYTRINVLFPVNRAVLLRDYANNEQALATLDRYLDETIPADIRLVVIYSAASPEGPGANNLSLSQRRGEALKSYILAIRPDLEDRIEFHSVGEDWGELSVMAANTPKSERKARLRNHPDYKQIAAYTLPQLRYARVDVTRESLPSLSLDAQLDWSSLSQQLTVPAPAFRKPGIRPVFGLSTNLPYDITYIPNYGVTSVPSFSLEFYPARGHWTVGADVEWPMWKHYEDHRFLQVNNITLWTRRYFKPVDGRFKGAYLFANANVARYGIGWNAKGWEGEGIGASLGAGYKVLLGKRLFLDFGAAVGAFYSAYDPYVYGFDLTQRYYYDYDGDVDKFTARRKRLMWVGPTRLYISLGVDLFNRRRK